MDWTAPESLRRHFLSPGSSVGRAGGRNQQEQPKGIPRGRFLSPWCPPLRRGLLPVVGGPRNWQQFQGLVGAQRRSRTADTGIFKPRGAATPQRENKGIESAAGGDVTDTSQRPRSVGKRGKTGSIEEAIPPVRAGTTGARAARAVVPLKAITAPKMKSPTGGTGVASPRATLIGSLTDAIRDASGAGDTGAAQVALEALSRLLGRNERR
ncbi:MAG: hypothetical protein JWM10_3197 [Myxococcaceae bacterium]|nr:hypothetical protein [Myxococcaceae bacterium]